MPKMAVAYYRATVHTTSDRDYVMIPRICESSCLFHDMSTLTSAVLWSIVAPVMQLFAEDNITFRHVPMNEMPSLLRNVASIGYRISLSNDGVEETRPLCFVCIDCLSLDPGMRNPEDNIMDQLLDEPIIRQGGAPVLRDAKHGYDAAATVMYRRVIARGYALESARWKDLRSYTLALDDRGALYLSTKERIYKLDEQEGPLELGGKGINDLGLLTTVGTPSVELLTACHLLDESVTFLFALPGMGKTTVAFAEDSILDVDYGNWRRALGKKRKDHLKIRAYMNQLADFMDEVARRIKARRRSSSVHLVVMLNEIDLLPFVKALNYPAAVVVPSKDFIDGWLQGISEREKLHPTDREDGYDSFAEKAADRYPIWLDDWNKGAASAAVPCFSLDTWLSKSWLYLHAPGVKRAHPEWGKPGPDDGAELHRKEE